MPTKPTPTSFAALAAARPTKAPSAPATSHSAAAAPSAAKALALNRTIAPERANAKVDYPKISLRLDEKENNRVSQIFIFLSRNGRHISRTAVFRTAMHLVPLDAEFVKHFDKVTSQPVGDTRISLNVLPPDTLRLNKCQTFLIENGKLMNAAAVARTAVQIAPLNDEFLRLYDELDGQDGRRRRPV